MMKQRTIVKEAHQKNLSIRDVVIARGLMDQDAFDAFFDYEKMIKPD
ncbi:hypothetical protein MGH68_11715 [Erysipelothrix sp. D19-032]